MRGFIPALLLLGAGGALGGQGVAWASGKRPKTPSAVTPARPASAGNWHAREGLLVQRNWGVDVVGVKTISSGYMLRFTYRILDAQKAQAFNDQKVKPYLIDDASGARLAVPAMENIGELRQHPAPEVGRIYFIIFGNPGKLVKHGSRVSVVIGDVRLRGLVAE